MNLLTNIHKKCSADAMCINTDSGQSRGRGPEPSKGDTGERNVVGTCCMREGGWRLCPKGRREATVKGSGGEKAAGWAGGWGSELPLATATAVQEALLPSVPPVLSLGSQVGSLQPNGMLRCGGRQSEPEEHPEITHSPRGQPPLII